MRFSVVTTSYKRPDLLERCCRSVQDQTVPYWEHATCQDGLTSKRLGAMHHLYDMINDASGEPSWNNDNTIIVRVDGDDQLAPNALEIVAKTYEKYPDTLLTHGSTVWESGRPARFNGEYRDNNFRGSLWKLGHLMTFRAGLFKRIKVRDLKGPDGNWLQSASDVAMMIPMAEMAGLDRIRYIPDPIYIYNDMNELNDCKQDCALQKRMSKYIMKKPRYKRIKTW